MTDDKVNDMLGGMDVPQVKKIGHQEELKIPLLSYRKSSKAGLWLLVLPVIAMLTMVLKYDVGVASSLVDGLKQMFGAIDRNPVFTYLIPMILLGLPLAVLVINFMAICHFARLRDQRELIITIKLRAMNLALVLVSFAIVVYFLLPDRASF
jgi:hypothetical protein